MFQYCDNRSASDGPHVLWTTILELVAQGLPFYRETSHCMQCQKGRTRYIQLSHISCGNLLNNSTLFSKEYFNFCNSSLEKRLWKWMWNSKVSDRSIKLVKNDYPCSLYYIILWSSEYSVTCEIASLFCFFTPSILQMAIITQCSKAHVFNTSMSSFCQSALPIIST